MTSPNPLQGTLPPIFYAIGRYRHLLVPMSFLALIGVLVVPLPPWLMDLLVSANISLAAIVLMTTIYMARPLDFSVFPALLLGTTLMRLVLNVASTRLILSTDANAPAQAQYAAGHVISAFANFVAGESIVVGAVIFVILIVVQFVVITKGATRMSEVAARFTLDAMPGKQMAIDADLSAGLINEEQARTRRDEIMREADFYGAMDGASKFVRGDAIAGIVITLVNVFGGFLTGALLKGWPMSDSLGVFTRLTIGDGLVSQVPSFIIAIAAGLIVARAGGGKTIGDEIPSQLASQPTALFLIGGFLALLSFTPLPTIPLLGAALLTGGLGWVTTRSKRDRAAQMESAARAEASRSASEPTAVEQLLGVDVMELEIGYGLVPLVDAGRGGDLLNRIAMIRRQLATEMGIVVPPVRIRDNVQLPPSLYRVKIRGASVGEGTVHPELLMAMDSGLATGTIEGIAAKEPAFGLEATWIEPALKAAAETRNYTVVDATSVVATHLTELIKRHAEELLTREEVNHLLSQLKSKAPKLVEETVPAVIKPGELQKVLQALLRERVAIRDLETILETLADWAPHTRDVDVLTEYVRNGLRRTICAQYAEPDETGVLRLHCVTMDPAAEDRISGYIDRGAAGTTVSVPPQLASRLARAVGATAEPLARSGRAIVVVAGPSVRAPLRQILDPYVPGVVVLGYNEVVRGVEVESVGLVQLEAAEAAVA
ncbi:MAG: flagellar biosynthesis protein FlhA [Phycisphaerales bacterium]|nr:flagellar biosynthesis protein FlhA [Phycisphaerales bacterium]